jgi:hypothetical protein
MVRYDALPPNLPPRGLSRLASATYVGVGVTKFDEMVEDGRMPQPKCIDSRKVWDVRALDQAFDALPMEAPGSTDDTWGDVDAA